MIRLKILSDFRLDWNLLSTMTPAINAWMNPSDRLIVAVKQLFAGEFHQGISMLPASVDSLYIFFQ